MQGMGNASMFGRRPMAPLSPWDRQTSRSQFGAAPEPPREETALEKLNRSRGYSDLKYRPESFEQQVARGPVQPLTPRNSTGPASPYERPVALSDTGGMRPMPAPIDPRVDEYTGGLAGVLQNLGTSGVRPAAPAPGMSDEAIAGVLNDGSDPLGGGRAPFRQQSMYPMAPGAGAPQLTDRENANQSTIVADHGIRPGEPIPAAPTLEDMLTAQEEYDLAPHDQPGKWAKILYGIGEVAGGLRAGIEQRAYEPGINPVDEARAERERGIADLQRNRELKYQREDRELTGAERRALIAERMARAEKDLRTPVAKGNFSSRGSTEDLFVAVTDQNGGTVNWIQNPNYAGPKVKFEGKDVWTSDQYGTEYLNTITTGPNGEPILVPVKGSDGKQATRALKPEKDGGPNTTDQRYADQNAIDDYVGSGEGRQKRQYHIGNAQAERLRAVDPNLTVPGVEAELAKLRAAAAAPPPPGAGEDKETKLRYEKSIADLKDRIAAIQKAMDDGEKEGDAAFQDFAKSRGRQGPSGRSGGASSGVWGGVDGRR